MIENEKIKITEIRHNQLKREDIDRIQASDQRKNRFRNVSERGLGQESKIF